MAFSVRFLFGFCPRVPIRLFSQSSASQAILDDFWQVISTHTGNEKHICWLNFFGIEESITKPSVLNFHLTMCLFTCVSIAWAERNVDTSKIHFIVAIVVIVDSKRPHTKCYHTFKNSLSIRFVAEFPNIFQFSKYIRLFFPVKHILYKWFSNEHSSVAFTRIQDLALFFFICQICYLCWFNGISLIRIKKV